MNLNNYKKLSGDASFRSFYRTKKSIIVHCRKNKRQNLLIYDAVNKLLIKNKIPAPKLISNQYKKNYIEIEDFGDNTIFHFIKKNKEKKLIIFKKIFHLLIKIQKIKKRQIKDFNKKYYQIPNYTEKQIINEANLFNKWYLPSKIKKKDHKKIKIQLSQICRRLIKKLQLRKKVFVHRDFHISNVMILKKKLALIDNQDALYGNPAYDLASLIDDVRFKTSFIFKEKIFNEYLKINKKINKEKLRNDFEILSVLRNLKIIGIFIRLSLRDKKHNYLKLIPYAWNLIESRIKDQKFKELNNFLKKHFPKKKLK
tara:strand:+ start:17 stop:952 length:936 start_codon:yes stop_codon:yes gene_type:complete